MAGCNAYLGGSDCTNPGQLVALLASEDGSGAAQWQLTYVGNGAYHVTNVLRQNVGCSRYMLSSSP